MSTADFSPEYEPSFPGPQPLQTNGWAVASLVCGILFCLALPAPLAVIFGIVALLKSRQPHVGGKGMAVAGLILGIIGIAFWILVASFGVMAYLFVGTAGSMEASQFTNLVAEGKIDEALEMTANPVTREDLEKLADDLKTWGKPGPFTAAPGFIPVVDPDTNTTSMTYSGTAKFEKAGVKKYSFTLSIPQGRGKAAPDPKNPTKPPGSKITAFKFE